MMLKLANHGGGTSSPALGHKNEKAVFARTQPFFVLDLALDPT